MKSLTPKHPKQRASYATAETQHEVQRRLLLDVVIRKGAPVLKLLAREDQALLIRRNAFLVLNLRLHVVDRVRRLDVERDGLASKRLHENLHTTTQAENQMKSALLLDVVIRKSASVLKLLAREDQALLIRRNAF